MVVAHDAAVRVCLRSTATDRIQAIALLFLFGAELVDELAVLEMTAALAVVMDGLAEDQLRLVFARQRNVCRA